MFQSLLNNEIIKLRAAKTPFIIENGIYNLADFSEASGTQNIIPLEKSILIAKSISVSGVFVPNTWTAVTTFFQLISKGENHFIELPDFKFRLFDTIVSAWNDFPSVHRVQLVIRYDLTTFLTAIAANIHRAELQYIKITPEL